MAEYAEACPALERGHPAFPARVLQAPREIRALPRGHELGPVERLRPVERRVAVADVVAYRSGERPAPHRYPEPGPGVRCVDTSDHEA